MDRLFSTTAVHPRDRYSYWHEVACKTIVDHDSQPASRLCFEAQIESGAMGGIDFILFENSALEVTHTRSQAFHAQSDKLFFCQQLRGSLVLEQEQREVALTPGETTLIDPALPYTGRFSANSKLLVTKLPRRALQARVGKVGEIVALPLESRDPTTRLASSFLRLLSAQDSPADVAVEAMIEGQALDLVAVAIAKMTGTDRPLLSSAKRLASLNLRAAIEARLSDPDLDPTTAARVAGIGVRYANAVLAEEGTSISRLILARRLERCRTALADPRQANRSISDIAYGWGFLDMTHFARSFRKAYGSAPREYRRTADETYS